MIFQSHGKYYGSVMKVGNWNPFETCKDPDAGKVWHITHY
ncbi:hypothetical protein FACS189493_7410 [Spirochaetia bacterium]|nr:hypothetical protein FACS189493_7410 [Spirochaetia bacterium]